VLGAPRDLVRARQTAGLLLLLEEHSVRTDREPKRNQALVERVEHGVEGVARVESEQEVLRGGVSQR
jgi:hypothetical protein